MNTLFLSISKTQNIVVTHAFILGIIWIKNPATRYSNLILSTLNLNLTGWHSTLYFLHSFLLLEA
jgi:hypothetical protein